MIYLNLFPVFLLSQETGDKILILTYLCSTAVNILLVLQVRKCSLKKFKIITYDTFIFVIN